jgi:adenylate cyclase
MIEELDQPADPPASLSEWSSNLGFDGALLTELAQILDWQDLNAGTESDIATLRVVATALELGMPHDALMQIVRVLADAMDRLADAEVRTFHDYVHERFRAQGLVGPELLEANRRVGKPVLELAEHAVVSFHRRAYQRAIREDLLRHLAEHGTPQHRHPAWSIRPCSLSIWPASHR